MQNMKKKASDGNNSDKGDDGDLKQKERHIVSWSEEEDDILREQVGIHGTKNWGIIASKFENKTTRQCRRRWFTYLNSDFKRGGWSQEEDMLLCKAQKVLGNRWTEIAKVVPGRTDNAVKNRFSILCKKRVKHKVSTKENSGGHVNTNNKSTIFDNRKIAGAISETSMHRLKMRRKQNATPTEDCNLEEGLAGDIGTIVQQLRPPFAILGQNCYYTHTSTAQLHANTSSGTIVEGTFLKKDDPKIVTLMQQAELLNSIALEVKTENTDASFKNAWKVVQDFLMHAKDGNVIGFHISNVDIQLENFKVLVEDIRSCRESNQCHWRTLDQGSPYRSEHSMSSTIASQINEKAKIAKDDLCEVPQPSEPMHPSSLVDGENIGDHDTPTHLDILPCCNKINNDDGGVCPLPNSEFNSPIEISPLFRSIAEGIPSPQFSESERHFLLKTLGMESTLSNPATRRSQSPPCKRALLHCL